MPYLLDTNVVLQAKNSHYGFDFCPAFWDWLKDANSKGIVYSIEKVKDELVDDEAAAWANGHGNAFFLKPDGAVVSALGTVSLWATSQSYEAAAVHTFLQAADYYLVAHALAHGFEVVTHEVPSNSTKKIKIPDACGGVGIKCFNPFEMLRRERANFVMG